MTPKGIPYDEQLIRDLAAALRARGGEEALRAASVTDKDETGWRKLTGDAHRNLEPLKQERMIKIAFWLWENNPLANWLIETTKDFILAEGLPYEAKNDDVKGALDGFWYDPLNRMDLYLEKHVRELFLFGELCLPRFRAERTGKVRLGYIDPANIESVTTDPDNVKLVIGVVIKTEDVTKKRKLKTILPRDAEEILSPKAKAIRERYSDGECHFFAINNVTNSPRGRSDLLRTADWLDAYEQFLFDYADKWPQSNSFIWDVLVKGGDDEAIKAQIKNLKTASGSVFGHNESVELKDVTPRLQSYEASNGAKLFRNHILGSHSFPEHWFGGGGDVNRATAMEMGTPAFKTLSSKQRYVKYILETIFEDVIQSRRDAGELSVPDEDAGAYSVITPELATKDLTKYSTVIRDLATSLVAAQNQDWLDEASCRKVFASTLGYLGIDVDVEAMGKAIEEARKDEGFEDYKED